MARRKKGRAQGEHRWNNWTSTLTVCRRQVQRALDSIDQNVDGECGLAIVATATMLEAYIDYWLTQKFHDGEHLVAEHLHEPLLNLPVKHRYLLLPRLVGRGTEDEIAEFESHLIHKSIALVFAMRNKFVHGDVEKWNPKSATPRDVSRLWNSALDVLLLLETVGGGFRIPKSRLEQYEQELKTFKVSISETDRPSETTN